MNKYNVLTINGDLDMSNPYKLHTLAETDLVRVPYTSGMTLNSAEWTFDTDENAFWISPKRTTSNRGYIKVIDENFLLSAEDEIEVEFEIKCVGALNASQLAGVRIDYLNEFYAYTTGSLDFMTKEYKQEYQRIKIKKKVPPTATSVTNLALIFGILTSTLQEGYSIKIRNIKLEVVKNRTPLTDKTAYVRSGSSVVRPGGNKKVGMSYFDTTIGKPIFWNGTAWVDAAGATV